MATVKEKELEARLNKLLQTLEAHGIRDPIPPAEKAEDRADYIEFKSDKHAAFLGLVPAKPGDEEYMTHTSPRTGDTYRLEDEITQFINTADPKQVAAMTLRGKVNELETEPEVPEGAPPMWRPLEV